MSERVELCTHCESDNTSCVSCDEWHCWACERVFYSEGCNCLDNDWDATKMAAYYAELGIAAEVKP